MRVHMRAVVNDHIEWTLLCCQPGQVGGGGLVNRVNASAPCRQLGCWEEVTRDDVREREVRLPGQQRRPADSVPITTNTDLEELDWPIAEAPKELPVARAIMMPPRISLSEPKKVNNIPIGKGSKQRIVARTFLIRYLIMICSLYDLCSQS